METDFFGIGVALEASMEMYFRTSRGTGRSHSMAQSVKRGDRVVFADSDTRQHFENLLREYQIEGVTLSVVDPLNPHKIFEQPQSQGVTIFDHSWLEKYYINQIQLVQRDISQFETESSGYGKKHIETKIKAREIAKFSPFARGTI